MRKAQTEGRRLVVGSHEDDDENDVKGSVERTELKWFTLDTRPSF
jgi:hypothetical protein